MKVEPADKKTLEFDPDKVERVYEALVNILAGERLTISELLVALGNTMYTVGASIEGYKTVGPDIDSLKKLYYSNPTIGNAMMVQALEVLSWNAKYTQQTIEKNLAQRVEDQETKEKT